MTDDTLRAAGGKAAEEDTSRVIMARNDYDNIVKWANVTTTPATRISEKLFDYLLNVLPPLYVQGARGYFISEMLTGNVTIQFMQVERYGERLYFAKYADVTRPHTWINDMSMQSPHPLNPNDYMGFVE